MKLFSISSPYYCFISVLKELHVPQAKRLLQSYKLWTRDDCRSLDNVTDNWFEHFKNNFGAHGFKNKSSLKPSNNIQFKEACWSHSALGILFTKLLGWMNSLQKIGFRIEFIGSSNRVIDIAGAYISRT